MAQVSLGFGYWVRRAFHLVYGIYRSGFVIGYRARCREDRGHLESTETSPLPRMEAIRKFYYHSQVLWGEGEEKELSHVNRWVGELVRPGGR